MAYSVSQDDRESFALMHYMRQQPSLLCWHHILFFAAVAIRWIVIPSMICGPVAIIMAGSNGEAIVLNAVATTFLLEMDNMLFKYVLTDERQKQYEAKFKAKCPHAIPMELSSRISR